MALERVERMLVTIFTADAEGYSPLMRADGQATHRTLGDYREITNTLIVWHDSGVRQEILLSRYHPVGQVATGSSFNRNRATLSS